MTRCKPAWLGTFVTSPSHIVPLLKLAYNIKFSSKEGRDYVDGKGTVANCVARGKKTSQILRHAKPRGEMPST